MGDSIGPAKAKEVQNMSPQKLLFVIPTLFWRPEHQTQQRWPHVHLESTHGTIYILASLHKISLWQRQWKCKSKLCTLARLLYGNISWYYTTYGNISCTTATAPATKCHTSCACHATSHCNVPFPAPATQSHTPTLPGCFNRLRLPPNVTLVLRLPRNVTLQRTIPCTSHPEPRCNWKCHVYKRSNFTCTSEPISRVQANPRPSWCNVAFLSPTYLSP